jgi:nucleotide-binding universal stress UspA family protein
VTADVSGRAAERASFAANTAPSRRSILVSLGGRRAPLEAIDFGRRIAETINATLHGLFVWPWHIAPSEVPRLLEIDPEVLSGMVLDVEVGDAAEQIAARTQAESVAFLVLPAESEGTDPCGLGVVAAQALQRAGSSVIIVRPGRAPRRIARILVPLDGTPRTAAAIAPAGELARFAGASLDIVMVGEIEQPPASTVELGAMSTPQYVDQPQHEWAAFSREFTERFLGAIGHCPSDVLTRFFLRVGDPASEILRAASNLDSDLIVLVWHGGCDGEHGRVFRRVLRETDLPVLVLRC